MLLVLADTVDLCISLTPDPSYVHRKLDDLTARAEKYYTKFQWHKALAWCDFICLGGQYVGFSIV